MTRSDQEVDVAEIPWVLAGPAGAEAPSLQSLGARAAARGRAGRRRGARDLAPARASGPARPRAPSAADGTSVASRASRFGSNEARRRSSRLSLAGPAAVTRLDVPPLRARALGVTASPRPQDARSFLDFLVGEQGNAAFRACGRTEAR